MVENSRKDLFYYKAYVLSGGPGCLPIMFRTSGWMKMPKYIWNLNRTEGASKTGEKVCQA